MLTPGRHTRTFLTNDEHRSKIDRNSIFDCHLSPVWRQMQSKTLFVITLRCYIFILHINVKMPTFMCRINFILRLFEHERTQKIFWYQPYKVNAISMKKKKVSLVLFRVGTSMTRLPKWVNGINGAFVVVYSHTFREWPFDSGQEGVGVGRFWNLFSWKNKH